MSATFDIGINGITVVTVTSLLSGNGSIGGEVVVPSIPVETGDYLSIRFTGGTPPLKSVFGLFIAR
jgi:hypothetical protein